MRDSPAICSLGPVYLSVFRFTSSRQRSVCCRLRLVCPPSFRNWISVENEIQSQSDASRFGPRECCGVCLHHTVFLLSHGINERSPEKRNAPHAPLLRVSIHKQTQIYWKASAVESWRRAASLPNCRSVYLPAAFQTLHIKTPQRASPLEREGDIAEVYLEEARRLNGFLSCILPSFPKLRRRTPSLVEQKCARAFFKTSV